MSDFYYDQEADEEKQVFREVFFFAAFMFLEDFTEDTERHLFIQRASREFRISPEVLEEILRGKQDLAAVSSECLIKRLKKKIKSEQKSDKQLYIVKLLSDCFHFPVLSEKKRLKRLEFRASLATFYSQNLGLEFSDTCKDFFAGDEPEASDEKKLSALAQFKKDKGEKSKREKSKGSRKTKPVSTETQAARLQPSPQAVSSRLQTKRRESLKRIFDEKLEGKVLYSEDMAISIITMKIGIPKEEISHAFNLDLPLADKIALLIEQLDPDKEANAWRDFSKRDSLGATNV